MLFFYSRGYPKALVTLLQANSYNMHAFWRQFWTSRSLSAAVKELQPTQTPTFVKLVNFLTIGICAEIIAAAVCIFAWWQHDFAGGLAFGLALLIGYPVVWAHMLALPVWLSYILRPKRTGKRILCRILEKQVAELRHKHKITIVAIVGAVGKTSTKVAVAKTLGVSKRVIWEAGNYNDRLTVPLVLFGHKLPGLFNVWAWLKIWQRNKQIIASDYPYDVAVLELGTDGPGQIAEFAYLKPDIVVVTAIAPEHMEYFGTLDAVAAEELGALAFAKKALVNIDDTPAEYLKHRKFTGYGLRKTADYFADHRTEHGVSGQTLTFHLGKTHSFSAKVPTLGTQGAKMAVAGAAVAHMLGEDNEHIEQGVTNIEAFAGRMRLFAGQKETTIVDDTYNASPIAVKAALDVLYATKAPQRIAILGTMNELGGYTAQAHREVGEYCDPKKLDLVITIGPDAAEYLAPAAKQNGCTVVRCRSPYSAAAEAQEHLKKGALILAKGSQNGVFAEEAVKLLLADPNDAVKLVRQSAYWLKKKAAQFNDMPSNAE